MSAAPCWLLLVEDDASDRDLTLHAMRRIGVRCRAETADNGVEALDLLYCRGKWADRDPRDLPEVVLLDLKLPLLNGLEVLRDLRSHRALSKVPVVMMTSSAEHGDLRASYELGVNSYVVKPVDIDEFFAVVGDVCQYWLTVNRTPVGGAR